MDRELWCVVGHIQCPVKGQGICTQLRRSLISPAASGIFGFTINDVRWAWHFHNRPYHISSCKQLLPLVGICNSHKSFRCFFFPTVIVHFVPAHKVLQLTVKEAAAPGDLSQECSQGGGGDVLRWFSLIRM